MVDFFVLNSSYVVLSIVMICWVGIFIYLLHVDRKISYLEQKRSQ
jgi:CcmD family protein